MEDIESVSDWKKIFKDSFKKTKVIYKHSNGCHICFESESEIKRGIENGKIKDKVYRIIVPQKREIADLVSKELAIAHESPQLILIKEGQVLFFANHLDINSDDIALYMNE